jgi:hypothetical protein
MRGDDTTARDRGDHMGDGWLAVAYGTLAYFAFS